MIRATLLRFFGIYKECVSAIILIEESVTTPTRQPVKMGDSYWNNRQQPQPQPQPPMSAIFKRPRPDYELPPSGLPSAHEMHNYLARDDNRGGPPSKEAKTLGSSYDLYLQNPQPPAFTSGEASNYGGVGLGRAIGGGPAFGLVDPVSMAPNGRVVEYGGRVPVDPMDRPGREPLPLPLPPDASKTLYIEGLPPNSTKREVAHIFRPFVGYKEVRLVSKESKHRGGDPLILCFVDFINPACAATALSALQGYKMDEHEPDSAYLRLQFSKFPGPRSGSGSGSRSRGKR